MTTKQAGYALIPSLRNEWINAAHGKTGLVLDWQYLHSIRMKVDNIYKYINLLEQVW